MTPDEVKVSTHALKRYRERFDPKATADYIAALAASAKNAPGWIRRSAEIRAENVLLVNGPVVFITLPPANGATKTYVITCVPLQWYESSRKFYGKKRMKKKFNVPKQFKGMV